MEELVHEPFRSDFIGLLGSEWSIGCQWYDHLRAKIGEQKSRGVPGMKRTLPDSKNGLKPGENPGRTGRVGTNWQMRGLPVILEIPFAAWLDL